MVLLERLSPQVKKNRREVRLICTSRGKTDESVRRVQLGSTGKIGVNIRVRVEGLRKKNKFNKQTGTVVAPAESQNGDVRWKVQMDNEQMGASEFDAKNLVSLKKHIVRVENLVPLGQYHISGYPPITRFYETEMKSWSMKSPIYYKNKCYNDVNQCKRQICLKIGRGVEVISAFRNMQKVPENGKPVFENPHSKFMYGPPREIKAYIQDPILKDFTPKGKPAIVKELRENGMAKLETADKKTIVCPRVNLSQLKLAGWESQIYFASHSKKTLEAWKNKLTEVKKWFLKTKQ